MSGLFAEPMAIPLAAQIECVERELKMRARVYERRVSEGKMSIASANKETESMTAVLATLRALAHVQEHREAHP